MRGTEIFEVFSEAHWFGSLAVFLAGISTDWPGQLINDSKFDFLAFEDVSDVAGEIGEEGDALQCGDRA